MGIWLTEREDICEELKNHFSSMSGSYNPPDAGPYLGDITKCITDDENEMLTAAPSDEEVRKVIFEMNLGQHQDQMASHLAFTS